MVTSLFPTHKSVLIKEEKKQIRLFKVLERPAMNEELQQRKELGGQWAPYQRESALYTSSRFKTGPLPATDGCVLWAFMVVHEQSKWRG